MTYNDRIVQRLDDNGYWLFIDSRGNYRIGQYMFAFEQESIVKGKLFSITCREKDKIKFEINDGSTICKMIWKMLNHSWKIGKDTVRQRADDGYYCSSYAFWGSDTGQKRIISVRLANEDIVDSAIIGVL